MGVTESVDELGDLAGSVASDQGRRPPGYHRSPRDLLRLVVYLLLLVAAALPTRYAERAVLGLESDVVALMDGLPRGLERVLVGVLQITVVAAAVAVVAVVPLVT